MMMPGRLYNIMEIGPWDWRHRIGFDLNLRREIKIALQNQNINSKERQIMNEIFDVFSGYISIDCLIDTVLSGKVRLLEDLASLPEENVLALPSIVQHVVKKKYFEAEQILGDQVRPLGKLLDLACSSNTVINPVTLMSIVFGDTIDDLVSYGKVEASNEGYPSNAHKAEVVKDLNLIIATYQKMLKKISAKTSLATVSNCNEFTTTIIKGPGFAEYWPWFLTENSNTNELVLYENEDSMRIDQFYPTLNHELYPGHAYFYRSMEQSKPRFVDHGAYGFVEGWATWAEWNGLNEAYSRQSRFFRLRSLHFLEADSPKYAEKIFSFMRDEGYNEQNAIEACLQFFQYPSLGLSYTLGALWFERYFRDSNPFHFFDYLSSNDLGWGDFFRLWQK